MSNGRVIMSQQKHQQQKISSRVILDQDTLIPLLARRSYHIPGNDWQADWRQWFGNNHILFGVCLHHPWHPVEWWERTLALTASVAFGLVATNCVMYISYLDPMAMKVVLFSINNGSFDITQGMLVLWTVGGLCHSIFDMIVWTTMACACCHPGGRFGHYRMSQKCRDVGSYLLIPVIATLLALAIYLVLLRASYVGANNDNNSSSNDDVDDDGGARWNWFQGGWNNMNDDAYNGTNSNEDPNYYDQDDYHVNINNIDGIDNFFFLQGYAVELLLAWCVYFPIIGTILFSGVLGCNGALPILGGRPRDIRIIAQEYELNGDKGSGYSKFLESSHENTAAGSAVWI